MLIIIYYDLNCSLNGKYYIIRSKVILDKRNQAEFVRFL